MELTELQHTTDATKWASAFCERFRIIGGEGADAAYVDGPGLMLGWFANAIEAGRYAARPSADETNDEDLYASTVLEEAAVIIEGAQQADYGSPDESFTRIAALWSAYLDVDVTKHDVAQLMILLKTARARAGIQANGAPQRDSLVDQAGYAGCAELLTQTQTKE